jgi:hypothetical protein
VTTFNPLTPPPLTYADTGLELPSVFTSETGAATMSSFESMSPLLPLHSLGIHGGEAADSCTAGEDGAPS